MHYGIIRQRKSSVNQLPSSGRSAKSVYLLQKYFEKHFIDTTGECYYYYIKLRQVEYASNECLSGCTAGINKFLYTPIET